MIKNLSSMSSMSQGLSFLDLNQISEEDEQLLSQVLASGGNSDLLPPECRSALHQVEIYEDVTTPSQVEEEDGEVEEVEEQPLCPQQLPDTPDESSSLNQDINAEALPDQQQEGQAVVQDECSSTYSQPDDVKAAQGHCIPKGYGDGNEESPGPIQTSTQIADTPNTSSIPSAMTPALGSEFTPPQFGTGPAPFHPTSVVPVSHLSSHPTSHAGSFPLAQGGTNPNGMSPSPQSPPIHFTPSVPPPPTPNQAHMYHPMMPAGPTVFVQNMTANVNVGPYSAHQAVAQPQVAGMNHNYMQPEAHQLHITSNKLGNEVKPDMKHRDNMPTRQPFRPRRGHGKGGRRHDPDRTQSGGGDHSGYGGDKHEGLMCQPPYHGMGGPSIYPPPQGMFQHYMQRSSIVNMPPVQAAQGQPLVYSHSATPYQVPPQYPPHNYQQMSIMQFHPSHIPHPHQPHHHQPHHPPQPLPQPPPQPPPQTASLHPQVSQVSAPSPAPIPSPAPTVTPVSTHPPTPTPCPMPPPPVPVPALTPTCAQESEVEMQGVEPESRQSEMECEVVCEVAPVTANPSPTVTTSSSPAKSKVDEPSPPCAQPPKNDTLAKFISSLSLDNLQPQLSVPLDLQNLGGDYSISFIDTSEPFVLESADDCTEGTSAQSDEQIAESPAQFSTPKVSEVKAVPNGSVEPQETPGEPELAAPAEIKPAVAPAPEAVILTTMSIPPPVIVASETQNQVVPEPSNTVAEEEVVPVLNKVVPNEPGKGFVAMKNVAEEVKVDIPVESQVVPESKVEEPKSSPQQTGIGAMKEEVPEVTPVPPGGAWAQKKSWSQLFKSPDGAPQKQVALVAPFKAEPVKLNAEEFPAGPSGTIVTPVCGQEPKMPEPLPIAQEDMDKAKIGEMLREYKHDHHQVALQPRGLINKGYWCYVNAPLQALLACPPFYNLMKNIPTPPIPKHGPSSTPVIDSIMTFVNEFSVMAPILKAGRKDKAAGGGRKEPEVVPGAPFEPAYVYKMLANINSELFAEGHQQDAEEMLSCVLNGLHDEMVEALKLAGGSDTCGSNGTLNGEQGFDAEEEEEEVEDEWKVMGPRKRSCVTRTAHFSPSPISAIFWGQLRSNLHQAGGHTTANLQPFTTLPLDIQSQRVESVHDALEQLVSREEITGYTCSKTHQEVAVSKQVMLEHLPQVLVLHLKRFIYDKDGGLQKVTKKVNFPVDLEVGKELMSSNSRGKFSTTQRRKYKLLAVVYHDGKEATKGHYVADVFHGGYSCWLRYDDNQVKQVREADVLHHATPRVPYLLFYRRGDTMVGPSTRTK
ncbi:ubiquitin specific protease 10 isoform X1 [Oratosquilla oratoria]|uniref:ubiquitin specific protease 10 isoform X1 n=1 Tax=Oratosquilla oratoria TaxID=337810 RepID=UPI003F76D2C0